MTRPHHPTQASATPNQQKGHAFVGPKHLDDHLRRFANLPHVAGLKLYQSVTDPKKLVAGSYISDTTRPPQGIRNNDLKDQGEVFLTHNVVVPIAAIKAFGNNAEEILENLALLESLEEAQQLITNELARQAEKQRPRPPAA